MRIDRKLLTGLGAAGGVLLLAWLASMLIFAGPRWFNWTVGIAALALIGLYAYQEREPLRRLALSPQMRHGSNAVVFTLAVVLAIALLNVIASRHSFRGDLTANKFFSLSDQTRQILSGLDRKVKITVFQSAGAPEAGQLVDLLEQYKHESKQLDVEIVDPDRQPQKAQIYKITAINTVVFESGGKRKDVLPHELFGYQFQGRQPQREFKGEPIITAAILSVSEDRQMVVHFLEGHGERSVDDASEMGLSQVKAGLERDNYEVKTFNLLKEGKIPEDAGLVVIAGPRRPIHEPELKLLKQHLEGDGRLLVLVDMESRGDLGELLKPWGVKILSGMVADPRSYYYFGGPLVPIPQYLGHRITDDLRKQGIGVLLPGTRALDTTTLDIGVVSPLLQTTPESWLETDWQSKSGPKFDSGKDKSGPLTLAVAVALNPESSPQPPDMPPRPPQRDPKLVVYGNVQWITNQIKGNSEANFDLFANSVNWLAGSEKAISIRPKEVDRRMVYLDNVKASLMWWVTVVLTPLAVIGIGVFRWWRRRSL